MAEETIGFIGTGRMGGPMAGRLLDAGYSLSIYDTQSEATKPAWCAWRASRKIARPRSHRAQISCWSACRPRTSSRRRVGT